MTRDRLRGRIPPAALAIALLGGALAAPAAAAQDRDPDADAAAPAPAPQTAAAPAPAPCSAPEHRQFDFWIGRWEVTNPAGVVVGTNRIERILDGCGLRETWEGVSGVHGTSLNIYSAGTGRWHQTWIDDTGSLLLLDGGPDADGAMVMTGATRSADGGTTQQRITWTPNADGTVRQLWEASEDGGVTWTVAFDGMYRKTG